MDWYEFITLLASMASIFGLMLSGLYSLIHKDIFLIKSSFEKQVIENEKEHKKFEEEMKEMRRKSNLTDMRLDGIYTILLKKIEIKE